MPEPKGPLAEIGALADKIIAGRRDAAVAPVEDTDALTTRLGSYDFAAPRTLTDVAEDLSDMMSAHAVRSDHPRYFGLFNPPALVPAIAGDLIASTINPQLAAWSHAPAAAAIEAKLIELFAGFVWPEGEHAGTFTSGGSEANHSALLVALARRYPDWAQEGPPRGSKRPAIYLSAESHLAWLKLARAAGLGDAAVRLVQTADGLMLDGDTLARAMDEDEDRDPVLVVATAGTTAHGAIDDLAGIARVAQSRGAHVHVDAAWAGGALIDPAHRHLFAGIDAADSVTIDPHKWLAVPMGAGMFLTRDWQPLRSAFDVSTGYMPPAVEIAHDPYLHSLQWSRRFTGAKLFVALATLGLDGYRAMLARMFALGDRLRAQLVEQGWRICNDTALPLVCFAPEDGDQVAVRGIEAAVVSTGQAWLSSVRLQGQWVLRACITSFETTEDDIDWLVAELGRARAAA